LKKNAIGELEIVRLWRLSDFLIRILEFGNLSASPRMKTTNLLICAISVASAMAVSNAKGQTISAHLIDISPGLPVRGTIDNGSFVQDYPSGVFRFTDFNAFCVEPQEALSYGESLIYEVQNISLLPNSDKIARLVGGFLASSQTGADAAAVQWAIWEVTNETLSGSSATPLLDGNVRIIVPESLATANLANQYLANINTYVPASLTYLHNTGRQDVVTWNLVPEPSVLGLTAFSALLCLRRRRR
jgi:hypothetical protein